MMQRYDHRVGGCVDGCGCVDRCCGRCCGSADAGGHCTHRSNADDRRRRQPVVQHLDPGGRRRVAGDQWRVGWGLHADHVGLAILIAFDRLEQAVRHAALAHHPGIDGPVREQVADDEIAAAPVVPLDRPGHRPQEDAGRIPHHAFPGLVGKRAAAQPAQQKPRQRQLGQGAPPVRHVLGARRAHAQYLHPVTALQRGRRSAGGRRQHQRPVSLRGQGARQVAHLQGTGDARRRIRVGNQQQPHPYRFQTTRFT